MTFSSKLILISKGAFCVPRDRLSSFTFGGVLSCVGAATTVMAGESPYRGSDPTLRILTSESISFPLLRRPVVT